jgi:hypothetical protein
LINFKKGSGKIPPFKAIGLFWMPIFHVEQIMTEDRFSSIFELQI